MRAGFVLRGGALALAGLLLGACASADALSARPLDPGDLRLMQQATQRALEKSKIGEGSNWSNPETGHLGTVTPLRTDESGAQPCRDYQVTLTIGGRTEFAYESACRLPDGQWRLRGGEALAGSRFEALPREGYYGPPYYGPPYYGPYYYDPYYYPPFYYQPYFGFSYRHYYGPRRYRHYRRH